MKSLPGHFVAWGHVTSFPVMWLPPTASYSLVGSEMYTIREFSAFYSHFQVSSGQMTSFPGLFESPEVTWGHFLSRDCLLLWATALKQVKCTVYASFQHWTSTSRWLAIKWRHFRVTSDRLRSRDIAFCHETASYCELQPCRKWNVEYTRALAFYSHFQETSDQMTSLPVTWGHVTSFCHVTASYCEIQPCRKWNVQYMRVFGLLHPLAGDFRQMTWLPGHFWSPEVTWVISYHVTASYY